VKHYAENVIWRKTVDRQLSPKLGRIIKEMRSQQKYAPIVAKLISHCAKVYAMLVITNGVPVNCDRCADALESGGY